MNKVFIKCGQQHICKEYTKKLRKIGEEKKKEWRNDGFKHPRCHGGVNKHTAH